ncbi:hypothetical protein VF14_08920 [Nostoc linckia z18]|uniref:Uncharacterized protein n=2 Tax=Nostoc linckia TaxID=92942 RepID=A0A9Q5ZEK5_NOSLI|nr:DUF6464 family protein [Nostoc linckia]PHK42564.1 hypothetical protein VF12_02565 [Nostoc linckia z15]PHK44540.1 hypothetical protein VF13_21270 [Nostoc linckia z16]PHJ59584.1 hypothetical protein VF02_24545 [Nostoc linckia z1]PHJ65138.1 hypothetical protein VF05_21605 [Nostoc linckia z3]PHJ69589.1 hypothetical protein VF03_23625 [Nostoc linckia z2]
MISIRQRRRNRHKIKAVRRQPTIKTVCTGFTIELTGVSEAFAQMNNTIAKLSETMARPEVQEGIRKMWQDFARLVPVGISQLGLLDTGSLRPSFNFESTKKKLVAVQEAELLRQYELYCHRYQVDLIRVDTEDDCLGDPSCKFNARRRSPPQASPCVQCAVNPSGNCGECSFYES